MEHFENTLGGANMPCPLCKSDKLMWKINKSIVKDMLPAQPLDIPIDPWWTVAIVNLTSDEYRKLSDEEMLVVEKVSKEDSNRVGELDEDVVRHLYRKGLIFLDVPVFPDDHFQVSILEGFVSNRDQSYEDPTEELLYAVFVASSEHATIAELAATLQADLSQLEAAVSLACRLGWAKKIVDPQALFLDSIRPGSPCSEGSTFVEGSDGNSLTMPTLTQKTLADTYGDASSEGNFTRALSGQTRYLLLVDANLTSYIMMGSLSPGLKALAVTLYEAGKLGDSSVLEICEDLRKVEDTRFEGELQEFADHAFSLRHILECLRSGGSNSQGQLHGSEVHQQKSVAGLDVQASSTHITSSAGTTENLSHGRNRVEVVRCESLRGLAADTIKRVFCRDYDVVVSIVPLVSSTGPGLGLGPFQLGVGPVHFGPPSPAALTPWMKLLLYIVAESGPISVSLIRGQRLRVLPHCLQGCVKALVWAWDGSGFGSKFDGTLVEGSILLHVLNSVLTQSAVFVQPFWKEYFAGLDESAQPITMEVPLPLTLSTFSCTHNLKAFEEAVELPQALISAAEQLHLQTVGYVRLLHLPKTNKWIDRRDWQWVPLSVEFGVPLFNTHLCKLVCGAAVRSELFMSGSYSGHQQDMEILQRKLQDFISDYKASGPISRLSYAAATGDEILRPMMDVDQQPSIALARRDLRLQLERLQSSLEFKNFEPTPRTSRTYMLETSPSTSDSMLPSPETPLSKFLDSEDENHVPLPGVNLLFNGSWLAPLDISTCLQGRLPASLLENLSVP
ncbi:hypothetical protein O6H91_Y078500 [Diphasiastrum complanatum]|nr:hypothetical protein O6H91_Y078500 [Diphasiastrum complanatum]